MNPRELLAVACYLLAAPTLHGDGHPAASPPAASPLAPAPMLHVRQLLDSDGGSLLWKAAIPQGPPVQRVDVDMGQAVAVMENGILGTQDLGHVHSSIGAVHLVDVPWLPDAAAQPYDRDWGGAAPSSAQCFSQPIRVAKTQCPAPTRLPPSPAAPVGSLRGGGGSLPLSLLHVAGGVLLGLVAGLAAKQALDGRPPDVWGEWIADSPLYTTPLAKVVRRVARGLWKGAL